MDYRYPAYWSLSKETENVENGLDYQAYLTILQLMHIDGTMHRVLDLMQINAQQEHPEFKIRHAAVGLEADFETSYEGVIYDCHQVGKY